MVLGRGVLLARRARVGVLNSFAVCVLGMSRLFSMVIFLVMRISLRLGFARRKHGHGFGRGLGRGVRANQAGCVCELLFGVSFVLVFMMVMMMFMLVFGMDVRVFMRMGVLFVRMRVFMLAVRVTMRVLGMLLHVYQIFKSGMPSMLFFVACMENFFQLMLARHFDHIAKAVVRCVFTLEKHLLKMLIGDTQCDGAASRTNVQFGRIVLCRDVLRTDINQHALWRNAARELE